MQILVVQKQMIIIFIMIVIGSYLYLKGRLSNDTAKQLSWIIVNITNPITLLLAALKETEKVSALDIGNAFICFGIMYAILIPIAYALPVFLGVGKSERYAYRMLAIFNNVGFIGIPFASAVLGTRSLIFVAICGLCFNLIFYTYGHFALTREALLQKHDDCLKEDSSGNSSFSLRNMINSGTVMAVITIAVYLSDITVPEGAVTALSYVGGCTTFLSMLVLGVSVAQMIPKEVFSKWRLYAFVAIRQVLVPILLIFVLKPFVNNIIAQSSTAHSSLMLSTIVIMASMPAANLPLMQAKHLGVKDDVLSAGIILTTIASIITIPAVMYFL